MLLIRGSSNGGDWYSNETNEEGKLAWGESYVLQALMAHYLGTGDLDSLDLVVAHGDRLESNLDDRRGVIDDFRQRSVPGWSSTKYTSGRPYVWAVHTGMIVAPLAELCALADERPQLPPRFRDASRRWKPWILRAVQVFDPEWRNGPAQGEGHYVGLSLNGQILPHNQMNALGRAMLAIRRWRGSPPWAEERAKKLLTYFKNRLDHDPQDDLYDWGYRGRGGGEDISHAAINVDFASRGSRQGLVFDAVDTARLARTFLLRVRQGTGFAADVSGGGTLDQHANQACRWLALARADPAVHDTIADWLDARRSSGRLRATLSYMLAAALLCRYR